MVSMLIQYLYSSVSTLFNVAASINMLLKENIDMENEHLHKVLLHKVEK